MAKFYFVDQTTTIQQWHEFRDKRRRRAGERVVDAVLRRQISAAFSLQAIHPTVRFNSHQLAIALEMSDEVVRHALRQMASAGLIHEV